jgi:hypothetical protein
MRIVRRKCDAEIKQRCRNCNSVWTEWGPAYKKRAMIFRPSPASAKAPAFAKASAFAEATADQPSKLWRTSRRGRRIIRYRPS